MTVNRLIVLGGVMCLFMATSTYGGATILDGAGATFPVPLYLEWFSKYQEISNLRINYQETGSGSGIKLLLDKKIDFGATDAFLSDAEMEQAPGDILHIPTCIGAVSLIYNLPGSPQIRLTPSLLADIFLGEISNWRHPELIRANPGVSLPDLNITLVHRSESSGTNFLITEYLAKTSPKWQARIGYGKIVNWPVGLGVEGNPGVSEFVKKISGGIGYVSLNYARQYNLPVALVQNKSGYFVKPSLVSVNRAAEVDMPADMRMLITDTDSLEGYPISAFTYFIFYKEQAITTRQKEQAEALSDFLWWCIHEGQQYNADKSYGALPASVVGKAEKIIQQMTFKGRFLKNDKNSGVSL